MTVFNSKIIRSYQQEDIQQILNIAITRESNGGEFSREQLMEIADELGISAENLLEAEQEWLVQQEQRQKHREFNLYRHSQLKKCVGKYLIVNSFLVCLNVLTAGGLSWSLYILLFWGLGLGLNAWNTYQLEGEEYERAFQTWYRKHQLSQIARSLYSRVNDWIKSVG
ncbi:MAG TPA: 2TM domain-containing protein [Allocoleopsis sp.]